jgi:uncharacterized protein
MSQFIAERIMPCSAAELFAYHCRPRAFERLTPPWEQVEVVVPLQRLENGAEVKLRTQVGPVSTTMTVTHHHVIIPSAAAAGGFVDEQVGGPFSVWRHHHRFEPVTATTSRLVDDITYELPRVPFAQMVAGGYVRQRLERLFRYRHHTTEQDLLLQQALPSRPLRVGITGTSGLIGSELMNLLSVLGHLPIAMVRAGRGGTGIAWDPTSGTVGPEANGLDAVVHLAGENIGDGRLDDRKLARIRTERVQQTRLLRASLSSLSQPPAVFVGASAVGFYGHRNDELLTETSPVGVGELPSLCAAWEQQTLAEPSAMRRVAVRIGIVQSLAGGALAKQLPVFRAGLGGPLGDGSMWTPVITVDDVAAVLARAVLDDRIDAVLNAVGPEPLRNSAYTSLLGSLLHRPAVVPVPRMVLQAAAGKLADEGILASARVMPAKLVDLGHRFRHADNRAAMAHVLGCEVSR